MLAYMTFPKAHRTKLHSTDVIDKRLAEEAGTSSRRSDELVAKSGARLRAPSGRLQVLPVGGVCAPSPRGGRGRHWPTKCS